VALLACPAVKRDSLGHSLYARRPFLFSPYYHPPVAITRCGHYPELLANPGRKRPR